MPVKIGFIDDIATTNLKNFVDVVRINIDDSSRLDAERSGFGELFGVRHSAKAEIDLEFDRLSQSNLGILRDVLHNQLFPHKVFLNHPADTKQIINFSGITNPSSTHVIRKASSDNANLTFGSATEISNAEYTAAANFGATVISSGTNDYSYFFVQFDLNAGGVGYLSAYAMNTIQRLTMFLHSARVFQIGSVTDLVGFRVEALRVTDSVYVEIYRAGVSSSAVSQRFPSLRLVEGFTNFAAFVDVSNKITFRIRNLQVNRTVSSGTHTGVNNVATLTDAAADFIAEGVLTGMIIKNITDGSQGTITARTATTITAVLISGTDNDWDTGDVYEVSLTQNTIIVVPFLLVNGFGTLHENNDNFTFRDTFTGAGYTGSLKFGEL